MTNRRHFGWLAVALVVLSACGGGGSGADAPPVEAPKTPSGALDSTYLANGKVYPQLREMAVTTNGDVYVTGEFIIKLDHTGATVASYGSGGQVALRSESPVTDDDGNLHVLTGLSVAKLDRDGRLVATFGVNGLASWADAAGDFAAMRLGRDASGNLYVVALPVVDASGPPHYGSYVESAIVTKLDPSGRVASRRTVALPWPAAPFTFRMTIAVDPGGPLYIGFTALGTRVAVTKLQSDGAPSWTWTDACEPVALNIALAVGSLGEVYVASSCGDYGSPRVNLIRLGSGGGVETRLAPGTSPFLTTTGYEEAYSVWASSGNEVYVAGVRIRDSLDFCQDFAVAKFDRTFQRVTNFGMNGVFVGQKSYYGAELDADNFGRLYVGLRVPQICEPAPVHPYPPFTDFGLYRLSR